MIGERLYDLRKDAGMTQDELAELLKISKHSISAYERDKNEPPDSIKIAIARLFNVSVVLILYQLESSIFILFSYSLVKIEAAFFPCLPTFHPTCCQN